jgi:hypothetical protein
MAHTWTCSGQGNPADCGNSAGVWWAGVCISLLSGLVSCNSVSDALEGTLGIFIIKHLIANAFSFSPVSVFSLGNAVCSEGRFALILRSSPPLLLAHIQVSQQSSRLFWWASWSAFDVTLFWGFLPCLIFLCGYVVMSMKLMKVGLRVCRWLQCGYVVISMKR